MGHLCHRVCLLVLALSPLHSFSDGLLPKQTSVQLASSRSEGEAVDTLCARVLMGEGRSIGETRYAKLPITPTRFWVESYYYETLGKLASALPTLFVLSGERDELGRARVVIEEPPRAQYVSYPEVVVAALNDSATHAATVKQLQQVFNYVALHRWNLDLPASLQAMRLLSSLRLSFEADVDDGRAVRFRRSLELRKNLLQGLRLIEAVEDWKIRNDPEGRTPASLLLTVKPVYGKTVDLIEALMNPGVEIGGVDHPWTIIPEGNDEARLLFAQLVKEAHRLAGVYREQEVDRHLDNMVLRPFYYYHDRGEANYPWHTIFSDNPRHFQRWLHQLRKHPWWSTVISEKLVKLRNELRVLREQAKLSGAAPAVLELLEADPDLTAQKIGE